MDNLFSMFEAFIGIYLLYSAVTGKGQAFKNENIKPEKRAAFNKFMRIFCIVMGPIFLACAAFDYLKISVGMWITYAISGIGIILALVVTYRMTDRTKKEKKS